MRAPALFLVLAACVPKAPPPLEAPAEDRAEAAEALGGDPTLPGHMRTHHQIMAMALDNLVHGDLAGVRANAETLDFLKPPETLPQSWLPYVADMKITAVQLSSADNVDQASKLLASTAGRCATCHEGLGLGPHVPEDQVPEVAPADTVMKTHKWAVDWMWTGLLTPSDDAWNRGADALAGVELPSKSMGVDADPDFAELETRIKVLAVAAVEAPDTATKEKAFADIVATCSACHARTPE